MGRRVALAAASLVAVTGLAERAAWAAPKREAPWLGVALKSGPGGGVVVDFVFKQSPAERGGMKGDDMVVSADGVPLDTPDDLVAQVRRRSPGEAVVFVVRRGGREHQLRVVLAAHPGEAEIVRRTHVGTRAPDLPGLAAAQGAVFSAMKDVRGEVLLVEFFASWCVGCRAQAPQLGAWHRRFAARGLRTMGVTDETVDEARKVAGDWKISYAVASDTARRGHRAYHVSGIPALFVIDRAGTIREAVVGYSPAQRAPLEKLLETLLGEKK